MRERSTRRAEARRAAQRNGETGEAPRRAPAGKTRRGPGAKKKKKKTNWFRITVVAAALALVLLIVLGIVNAVLSAAAGEPNAGDGTFFATTRPNATAQPQNGGSVPASTPQNTAPFANTLFVGDSMTGQLVDYISTSSGDLKNAKFATADNYSWSRASSEAAGAGTLSLNGADVTLSEAVAQSGASELYIMLGKNDLIDNDASSVASTAQDVLDTLAAAHPDLKITVQSITPMLAEISYEGLSNSSIARFNDAMESYCAGKSALEFLDVASVFPDGVLPFDNCADTNQLCIHLNDSGCALWADCILNGPVEPTPEPSPEPDNDSNDDGSSDDTDAA